MARPAGIPDGLGVERVLRGSDTLLLTGESTFWVLLEGTLALFSVGLASGQPTGSRSSLFTVEAGEVLFGVGAGGGGDETTVQAVPLGEVRVLVCSGEDRLRFVTEADAELADRVGAWTLRWAGLLGLAAPGAEPGVDPGLSLLRQLGGFNERLRRGLRDRTQRKRSEDVRRLTDSDRSARDSGRLAVQKLRSVLEESDLELALVGKGDALFRAAYLVAQAVGAELRPLPTWYEGASSRDPVEALARGSQLRTRRVTLEGKWWREDCGPLLAKLDTGGSPVALLREGDRYVLVDAALDTRTVVDASVAAGLDRDAHTFYRSFPAKALGALDLLHFALGPRLGELRTVVVVGVLGTLLAMVTPVATGLLVDHAIPDANKGLLLQLMLALFAAAMGGAMYRLASGFLMMRVEMLADAETQGAVWDRLLRLKASFFRRFTVGDLRSRVFAVSRVRSNVSGASLRTALASLMALLNLGLLLYYSPSLAAVACVTAAVTALCIGAPSLILLRYERELEALSGEIDGALIQLVQGVSKLRVAAAEERGFLHWANRYSRKQELVVRKLRIRDVLDVVFSIVESVSVLVLFAAGAKAVGDPATGLSTGEFLAFYTAYGAFLRGLVGLSRLMPVALSVAVLKERAQPILASLPEVDAGKADPGLLRGKIQFDKVSFRYRSDGPLVSSEVSFEANPGELIAFVGPSGGGKSTLVRLLLGFESAESGQVLIDGQDLRGLDLHSYRRQLGVVLQGGRLGAGSIFENVSMGRNLGVAAVHTALRRAGLESDVSNMPMGIHTVVGEGGSNLSGGQRQRVLIARALAGQPRVLIFDEATSHLDNRTQAVVTESLASLEATRVVVAHRLSTVRDADRIYVIDNGVVVEEGDCQTLLERGGVFASLAERQLV